MINALRISLGLGILSLLVYGLWPLRSKRFSIQYSEAAIQAKEDFLKAPVLTPDSLPNIILILADDLGFHDISLNGNQLIETSNIDALALEGVNCTQAYVTAPVCAPSRAGLLTGRYQHRFGFENQMHQRLAKNRLEQFVARNFMKSYPWKIKRLKAVPKEADRKKQGLPPTEFTLAELLKKQGYATGIIGKWHLGSYDYSLPHKRGFDSHYGFYQSHSLFAPEGSPGIVDMRNPGDWTDKHIWKGQREGECAIVRNGIEIEEPEYLTTRIAEEAVEFIETNKEHPFFLFLPFSAPHTPFQAPKSVYDELSHIDDPVVRTYQAMIKVLDDAIGTIHNKVKTLGLEENTIIFFLSDNGGATYTLATDNGSLNGGKITAFNGGLKVPFFVKWKGQLPAGFEYKKAVSALDIFATSCAISQTQLPEDRVFDGVNLIPYINGELSAPPHAQLFWKSGASRIVLQDCWKLFFDDENRQTLLYNMAEDPYEQENLAPEMPDKVEELIKVHSDWYSQMPGPLWPPLVTFTHKDDNGVYYFDI
jgi:arylsulfatase A-like enzyme